MKELSKTLKSVSTILANNSVLGILDNVLVEKDRMIMTDLRTTAIIPHGLNVSDSFCVEAKLASEVLKGMAVAPNVSVNEKKVTLSSGIDRFVIETEDPGDFPKPPSGDMREVGVIELDKIRTAINFLSNDELRPVMGCICLRGAKVYATDAHRLYFDFHSPVSEQVLITRRTSKLMLLFGGSFSVFACEGYVSFSNNDGVTIIQRQVNEKFPDADAVIPVQRVTEIKADRNSLLSAIEKATRFANTTTKQVVFDANGSLKIASEDADYGREYKTEIFSKKSGEDIRIAFNGKFLGDIVKLIPENVITLSLSGRNKAAILNGKFLLMPIMLNK